MKSADFAVFNISRWYCAPWRLALRCVFVEIFVVGFGLTTLVADGISIYIIVMELISICENLEELGVPIPKFIKRALAVTNEKIIEEDKEDDNNEEEDDKEEE